MWHEGEGKAAHPNLSVFQGDRRDLPRKTMEPGPTGCWGNSPSESDKRGSGWLGFAGSRVRNAASAVVRGEGCLSEELRQIDHLGQAVIVAFEQDLPLHLGRA